MSDEKKLTKEELEKGAKLLYHHVECKQLRGLRIKLTERGQRHKKFFSILGLSSKESIQTGLKAVDASPFKTVFVVDEESGKVLFALSKNEEYVEAARKKKDPEPAPQPLPEPLSYCCQICKYKGGYACDPLPSGDCICYGATRDTGGVGLDDPLEKLVR
jgi:hypothetical protein